MFVARYREGVFMRNHDLAIGIAFLLFTQASFAADTRRDLVVGLRFVPQEGVSAPSPEVVSGLTAQPVTVAIEDVRGSKDPQWIGRGTNDDDETFKIRAASEAGSFFRETVAGVLADWGIESQDTADRGLRIEVKKYWVEESNKAVGSGYSAQVELRCVLTDKERRTLAEIESKGTANRYGRARSADNCNEVLSDALKDAVAAVLSDASLQKAWVSGAPQEPPSTEAVSSIEERLARVEELFTKGVITREEYEKKRAEILGEL